MPNPAIESANTRVNAAVSATFSAPNKNEIQPAAREIAAATGSCVASAIRSVCHPYSVAFSSSPAPIRCPTSVEAAVEYPPGRHDREQYHPATDGEGGDGLGPEHPRDEEEGKPTERLRETHPADGHRHADDLSCDRRVPLASPDRQADGESTGEEDDQEDPSAQRVRYRGPDGRTGHAEGRERAEAEDEDRVQHDVRRGARQTNVHRRPGVPAPASPRAPTMLTNRKGAESVTLLR